MKVKHVLVLLAIAACLIASGAAVFVKLSFDALDYTYDPDAIKARHIEEVKSRVQWSREHPSSAHPIVKAGTPVAIGEECDSLLSAAIIQNGSAQPEIKIDGFLDERPGGKLWVTVAIRFPDGTQVIMHSYQDYFISCELR